MGTGTGGFGDERRKDWGWRQQGLGTGTAGFGDRDSRVWGWEWAGLGVGTAEFGDEDRKVCGWGQEGLGTGTAAFGDRDSRALATVTRQAVLCPVHSKSSLPPPPHTQGTFPLGVSSSAVMMAVFSTQRRVFKHSGSQRHPVTQVTRLLHAANLAARRPWNLG